MEEFINTRCHETVIQFKEKMNSGWVVRNQKGNLKFDTYGIGIKSTIHCGKNMNAINFNATNGDGWNSWRFICTNSDSFSLSKHFGSMLNADLMTVCTVYRTANSFALNSVSDGWDLMKSVSCSPTPFNIGNMLFSCKE